MTLGKTTEMIRYEYTWPTTGLSVRQGDLITRPLQSKRFLVVEVRGHWLRVKDQDTDIVSDFNTANIGRIIRFVEEPIRDKAREPAVTTTAKKKQRRGHRG